MILKELTIKYVYDQAWVPKIFTKQVTAIVTMPSGKGIKNHTFDIFLRLQDPYPGAV